MCTTIVRKGLFVVGFVCFTGLTYCLLPPQIFGNDKKDAVPEETYHKTQKVFKPVVHQTGEAGKRASEVVVLPIDGRRRAVTISTPGEEAWYQLNVSLTSFIVIQTHGDFDTYLTLYEADQLTVIEEDDNDGQDDNALISRQLTAGAYYVKAQFLSSSSTGGFEISASGNVVISNAFVEIAMTSFGNFTMGVTGGDPDNPADDSKILIYGHPYGRTTFTSVRVDGNDFLYGGTTGTLLSVPTVRNGNIEMVWRIGDIEITEQVSIIRSGTTDREDTAGLRYIMTNRGSSSHDVGLRVMFDTMLGDNDGAPINIPGSAYTASERDFRDSDVPQFWYAIYGDDIANPVYRAQGTLKGFGATTPDRFVTAYWRAIAETLWDYTIDPGRIVTDDSAVGVWWNPLPVAPGSSHEIVTFYGLGAGSGTVIGDLSLDVTSPVALSIIERAYSPNPFSVNLLINYSSGATVPAFDVTATIELPSGLQLASGEENTRVLGEMQPGVQQQVTWDVMADGSATGTLTYIVRVSSGNAGTGSVSRSIEVPLHLPTAEITVTPSQLSLGSLSIGAAATRSVSVENTGDADLLISGISSDNSQFSVAVGSFTVKPGESRNIEVAFTPVLAGDQTTILTITSNDPAHPTMTIDLSGTGLGVNVWPGDTNNDGRVDGRDILPIGIFWGVSWTPSPTRGSEWRARGVASWSVEGAAYADADGNGMVDAQDIFPVAQNWRRTWATGKLLVEVGNDRPALGSLDLNIIIAMYRVLETAPASEGVRELRVIFQQMMEEHAILPQFTLFSNVPNPFNPMTTIRFTLPARSAPSLHVTLKIYNIQGQWVRTLIEGRVSPGEQTVVWDGTDEQGRPVASGVYLYRFEAGEFTAVRRMVLLR